MNIKKLKKEQLINKINQLEKDQLINKIDLLQRDSQKSVLSRIIDIIIKYKTYIFNFWITTLIIRLFKTYSIFRKIISIISSILLGILGISISDIYGLNLSQILEFIRSSWIYQWFYVLITSEKEVKDITESSRTRPMGSNNQSFERTNNESWGFTKRNIKQTSEEINNTSNPIYENRYIIIGVMFVISCTLIFYYYNASTPGNNSNIIDTSGNLQTRLNDLFNKNVSDNFSNSSDETVTNHNKYFKSEKVTDNFIQETSSKTLDQLSNREGFIQGSSSQTLDQLSNREVVPSKFWSLPIAALSSRYFLDQTNDIELINNSEQENNSPEENIIDSWKKIKLTILNKDTNFSNSTINIHFGELGNSCKSLSIKTIDGNEIIYDLSKLNGHKFCHENFNWASNLNSLTEIQEVIIEDKFNQNHLIYTK